ncbi:hypothetical protein YC2023_094291 [Brassica napus]
MNRPHPSLSKMAEKRVSNLLGSMMKDEEAMSKAASSVEVIGEWLKHPHVGERPRSGCKESTRRGENEEAMIQSLYVPYIVGKAQRLTGQSLGLGDFTLFPSSRVKSRRDLEVYLGANGRVCKDRARQFGHVRTGEPDVPGRLCNVWARFRSYKSGPSLVDKVLIRWHQRRIKKMPLECDWLVWSWDRLALAVKTRGATTMYLD